MQQSTTNHQPQQEIEKLTNILVLGESGVGKSTWINSIAKYLLYPTLEDAVKSNDNTAIIPSQFSHTKNDGETVKIKIGDFKGYDNENTQTGASATKKPTTYLFDFDDMNQIQLIDTPGFGNTAGIQKDNENFEMVLRHIAKFKEIHGICILLKPNSARLSIFLRFYIKELLNHLHKSAAHNIVFCFTDCRGTFYQPGETLPALKQLLKNYKESNVHITEKNRFCFDNESFRLLACLQNGIHFTEKSIKAYSLSWQRAASETRKLFQYVFRLNPHKTEETLSLNATRKWIVQLSQPIALVQKTISELTLRMEDKRKELLESKSKVDVINQLINEYSDRIDAENGELKEMVEISATFACFLTRYSIAGYNDDVEGQMDYLIDKKSMLGDNQKVKELWEMKHQYITQKDIIEKSIAMSSESNVSSRYDIDIEGAEKLKERLFQLKIHGRDFKKVSEDIARGEATYQHREVVYVNLHGQRGHQTGDRK